MVTGSFDVASIFSLNQPLISTMPLSFIVLLLILPIKLKKSPFDVAEAHQELTGGAELEFSGIFYEAVYTARWLDNVFCYALVYLFGATNPLLGLGLALATFLILSALDNTTARVNYKQMLRFSLMVALPIAFINLILTILQIL
jgi:ech hydrogenase subunit B